MYCLSLSSNIKMTPDEFIMYVLNKEPELILQLDEPTEE